MVRPVSEYGRSVWQSALENLTQDVEDMQRRATKMIAKLKDKPYAVRLEILKHRRRRGDMIVVLKYIQSQF